MQTSANAVSPVLSSTPNEVSCVLIPMKDRPLILPGAAVAEVVKLEISTGSSDSSWQLGTVVWREIEVPVVSMELMKGEQRPAVDGASHIAIINSVLGKVPFMAVEVQGVPRVMRVISDEVHEEPDAVAACESMNVAINADLAVIPHLEYIEQAIVDLGK